jgi:hypothetical protein
MIGMNVLKVRYVMKIFLRRDTGLMKRTLNILITGLTSMAYCVSLAGKLDLSGQCTLLELFLQ